MKKRITALVLAFLLTLGLAACGQSVAQSGTTADTAAAGSNGGAVSAPLNSTLTGAEPKTDPTKAAEETNDPDEIVEIMKTGDIYVFLTSSGAAYYIDEDNPFPGSVYEHVKKAYFGSTGLHGCLDYIDTENNFYSNGVDFEHGGLYENEKLFEGVDQVVTIGSFHIYKTVEGKAYIHETRKTSMAYGGTTEPHDHELVAEGVKAVYGFSAKDSAYLTENGELYWLTNNEWKLLCDHVSDANQINSLYLTNLILTEDGTLKAVKTYPTELVDLDQDVERIYPDLSVYQKNGKLYNAVFVEGKLTALEMPQNEVDVPMYCGGEKLVYLGTDGMLHCSVNSYERIGGTLVLSCVSDVSYAGKLDSMEAVYRFLED